MSKKNDLLEPDSMSFEQASEELDAIVKSIDEGSGELEEMLRQHARGQALVKRCRELLSQAEQQLKTAEVDDIA
ncbi:MAG TPA: exodeoxyribonuclease VII small subunit [Phycisphaerales bacterium]|jgi:exodeoxyribonuclease VII small subunit|nr:exodeoxyribonuclease VII small subunit [Phycisphaerales bacterium]|tara:strand:+ start:3597 stop:3818 length:222 start_codon:yes stop_codon:yes gene_type:complete